MANKSVVLYQSIKVRNKWILCPVDEDSSHFPRDIFYVRWYDGKKKQMELPRRAHKILRVVGLVDTHGDAA